MDVHDCTNSRPVRPPTGVERKRQDYDETAHIMVDLTKMDDGRWMVTVSRYVPGPDGDLIEAPEPAMYISNPPGYLPSDVDVDVWTAADMVANVVMHQSGMGAGPVQEIRNAEVRAKYV